MSKKIKTQFKEELKKGTGKAILLFKRYRQKIDFRKDLIEAAIHNPDYDPQCSGPRAVYLYDMIKLLPDRLEIENRILKRFLRTYWCSVEQLFNLAFLFAKNGNEYARTALYRKFKDELGSPDGPGVGGDLIVELDGIEGFLKVAELRGKQLLKNKNDWEDHLLLEEVRKSHPKQNVMKILKDAAKSSAAIRAYRNMVVKSKDRWKKSRPNRQSYKQIKKLIDSGGKVPHFWGFKATQRELKAAAMDFIKERDSKKIVQYLRIYYKGTFPLPLKYLLNWKRYKTKESKMWALNALEGFKNYDVRCLALKLLKRGQMVAHAMSLMEKNFKDEDTALIEKILWKETDPVQFHGEAMSVIDICRDKKAKNPKRLLAPIYERGYCAGCRERLIRAMFKNGILSKRVQREALLDCNMDTRAYVRRYGR